MAKTIYTKDPVKFIPALAEALKKIEEFEVPEWATLVKSGVSRERPPVDDDFWYTRAASILRQLYIKGVVGVGKLQTRYGSRKDRGGRASKFKKSGGKIIRVILQQAEAAGLVEKVSRLQHGRRLSAKGRELLDSIEVEAKKDLDYEAISMKPMEIIKKDDSELEKDDSSEPKVEEVKNNGN
jgi:small subunit ribosomal protein S19e